MFQLLVTENLLSSYHSPVAKQLYLCYLCIGGILNSKDLDISYKCLWISVYMLVPLVIISFCVFYLLTDYGHLDLETICYLEFSFSSASMTIFFQLAVYLNFEKIRKFIEDVENGFGLYKLNTQTENDKFFKIYLNKWIEDGKLALFVQALVGGIITIPKAYDSEQVFNNIKFYMFPFLGISAVNSLFLYYIIIIIQLVIHNFVYAPFHICLSFFVIALFKETNKLIVAWRHTFKMSSEKFVEMMESIRYSDFVMENTQVSALRNVMKEQISRRKKEYYRHHDSDFIHCVKQHQKLIR